MNGIENITSRIISEAEAYALDVRKNTEERYKSILSEAKDAATVKRKDIEDKCQRECAAILSRSASSAEMLEKNILLDAKSVIIDGAFEKAKKEISLIDGDRYFDFLFKTLLNAVKLIGEPSGMSLSENGEPYILVMSLSDKEKYGERLKDKASLSDELKNKRIAISENASDSLYGLIVKYGSIEVNATADAIINTARQTLESEVYKALFN